MIISDFRQENNTSVRISARITFEESNQPDKDVFIETTKVFGSNIHVSPTAFLVGTIIPALYFREKRISVDAKICPGLLEGLETVMALMASWSGGKMPPLVLECRKKKGLSRQPVNRAGMVFSGGVDSLAALRLNRLRYPESHPGYIRDCFFIHGFDIGGVVARGSKYYVFDRAVKTMKAVTDQAGARLVPVYTNFRHLCDDRELWLYRFHGAVLASIAHSFSSSIDFFYIASTYDIDHLGPSGSHPLIDPEYSSFDIRIKHRDASWPRIDKLRLLTQWDLGLSHLRVCLANVKDRLNCGKCEKCVRTMTGLVALGALDRADAFVEDDVTPDMFDPFKITIRHREPFYRELLPLLEKKGRMDLVNTIRRKLQ
ncbi:MAG: hypothetical protein U9P10_14275 [Thermodesulfobacteriota bacterium]|nr:hypothetical protein [Thermodesulfobacteriota bacterium]